MMYELATYLQSISDWTEKHPGLGVWVGAVGSIVAILAAWGLARAEYLRTKRQALARRKAEIELISKIISEFEAVVQWYAVSASMDTEEANKFYNKHMNDSEWHAMYDLAQFPVIGWPSLETYASFKRYWFLSLKVLETSHAATIDKTSFVLN
jgi:hypothetical protein